jgi:GNAT superfamily N-acetyltransferase
VADNYRVRPATLDDVDALVRHRIGMFSDMGLQLDAPALERSFRAWLAAMMPAGTFRAWLVEAGGDADRGEPASRVDVVAGGGITVLPWPPGPRDLSARLAFVYNVYTEPAHRRRGLARRLMDEIHAWCREAGIGAIALNASEDGRPLYESLGYRVAPAPMMFFAIDAGYNPSAQAT